MSTKAEIVECAQRLIQTRGYNAFSFGDISEVVGIKTASIHHYFPSKTDLGLEVLEQYRSQLRVALAEVSKRAKDSESQLQGLISLLDESCKDGSRLCLCAMLMSDAATLDKPMQKKLAEFLTEVETWLGSVLEQGRKEGELRFEENPIFLGRALFASFQGMMMCARAQGDLTRFPKACRSLVKLLRK